MQNVSLCWDNDILWSGEVPPPTCCEDLKGPSRVAASRSSSLCLYWVWSLTVGHLLDRPTQGGGGLHLASLDCQLSTVRRWLQHKTTGLPPQHSPFCRFKFLFFLLFSSILNYSFALNSLPFFSLFSVWDPVQTIQALHGAPTQSASWDKKQLEVEQTSQLDLSIGGVRRPSGALLNN